MPRQDVPYGGAICRLKERIAEIWDKLDQKLHSINGVEGDGAGNVEIVSGNDAVVINNDQIGHRIEVSLDSSKLPASSVSSVNGQTGAVRLDAKDILSDGNSNVQADIAANKAAINDCFDSITSEQVARQNADAALQDNINSVQASIPGAAAAAVSNDPTVAQLAADVPGKLDKISSGSTLKAYTHTGQNQGETDVVNGFDANSIGLRDANGRMQAADPAAGATDKTLVTANWISQSGDTAPNNLMHRNGSEIVTGIKTFDYNNEKMVIAGPTSNSDFWVKIARWTGVNLRYGIIMTVTTQYFRDVNFYGKLMFGCWDRTNFGHLDLYAFYDWSAKFKLTWDGSEIALWFHNTSGKATQNLVIFIEAEWAGTAKTKAIIPIDPQDQVAQAEPDWTSYVNVLNCEFKGATI